MTKRRQAPVTKEATQGAPKLAKAKAAFRKMDVLDQAFLQLAEAAFEDWKAAEDDATFHDLSAI